MQFEKIYYEKCFPLGGYSNEKIDASVTIEPGDEVVDAYAVAKKEVEKAHQFFQKLPEYESAKNIVENPNDFTGRQIQASKEVIAVFEENFPEYITKFFPASRQLNNADHG